MSKTVPLIKKYFQPFARLLVFSLATFGSLHSSFASTKGGPTILSPCRDKIYTILVNKSLVNKKYKVRLYPDARGEALFFSAAGPGKKIYQLYLFDMDGKQVEKASIRNLETTVLTNITEGNYLFEVFSDDERIENGQITVK